MMLVKSSINIVIILFAISVSSANASQEGADHSDAALKLGKRAFIRCQACHTLGADEAHLVGPNLNGLFGSTAGRKEGFDFSAALKDSGLEWNQESLQQWLKSPSTFIPGNKMAFVGVPTDKEMDALLNYLKINTK